MNQHTSPKFVFYNPTLHSRLTLHELSVLEKRMSISSRNSFGSFLIECGMVTEDVSDTELRNQLLNCTLSRHYVARKRKTMTVLLVTDSIPVPLLDTVCNKLF